MQLYESHTIPSTYATFVRFSRPRTKPIRQQLIPPGSEFHIALDKFLEFFRKKCKIHWSERLDEQPQAHRHKGGISTDQKVSLDHEPDEESPEEREIRRIFGELAKNPETKIIDTKAFREKELQRLSEVEMPFVYIKPKPGRPVGLLLPRARASAAEQMSIDKAADKEANNQMNGAVNTDNNAETGSVEEVEERSG